MEKRDKLKILQARRSAVKGNLNSFQTFLSNYTSKDYVQLHMRFQKLTSLFQNFDELHDELDTLDNSESSINERFAILESYYQAMSTAQQYLSNRRFEWSEDIWFQQKIFPIKTESLRSRSSVLEINENKRSSISKELSWFLNLPKEEKNDHETIERFVDELRQHLQSLSDLGVALTEEIVVFLVQERFFNEQTKEKWESSTFTQDDFPKLDQLFEFLSKTARLSKREYEKSRREARVIRMESPVSKKTGRRRKCFACFQDFHHLTHCDTFRDYSVRRRLQLITEARVCRVCLNKHTFEDCLSRVRCRICDKKHHTWIHVS